MPTPVFADSSETTAALRMRIDARHMFRIKAIALGNIAPKDDWRPGPAYDHYCLDRLGL